MPNYKIISSDLDGTLLRRNMTVSDEDTAAIAKLSERGVIFAPNSGRTLYEIPAAVRENPNIRYIAYSNGTAVYDKVLSRDIISNRIPKETVKDVLDVIADYKILFSAHIDGRACIDEGMQNDDAYEYYRINDYYKVILSNLHSTSSLNDVCVNSDGVESIILFFHSDEELELCRARLEAIEGLTITSSVEHNLEVCSDKAGKGEALAALADMLGIHGEDIISVGDNMNDTAMFSVSGLALCVSSGSDAAKEFADEVICSNEESPIDYIMTHYIDAPKAAQKPKKNTIAAIIAAASAVVAIFFAIIAISIATSGLKVGYSGIKNTQSWSATYVKLDGNMSHSMTPKNDEVRISVTTESGEISIEIKDSKGNVIFDEENIGTREFALDTNGKIYIKIEADDHKGKFVIG